MKSRTKPSSDEMVRAFFPNLGKEGTKGDQEAAMRINKATCLAVLADLSEQYRKQRQSFGPGVLVIHLKPGPKADTRAFFLCLDAIEADRAMAEMQDDVEVCQLLDEAKEMVSRFPDPKETALFMLIDSSTINLIPMNLEDAAASLDAKFKALAES